jgi:hypothetical protein
MTETVLDETHDNHVFTRAVYYHASPKALARQELGDRKYKLKRRLHLGHTDVHGPDLDR